MWDTAPQPRGIVAAAQGERAGRLLVLSGTGRIKKEEEWYDRSLMVTRRKQQVTLEGGEEGGGRARLRVGFVGGHAATAVLMAKEVRLDI